jgi:iron(III) transport system ATP-binding protein
MTHPARLQLTQISHRYGAALAVDDVSLSVAPGEILCLLGPSGCGKSTLLRLCAGLERLSSGRILIDGAPVADEGLHVTPERRGVGMVFQEIALFPHLSVAANVAFGLRGVPAATVQATVAAMLARVGMAGFADAYPHTLSGGQQQRVALARALAPQPRLMLLDEPFSGLDARLRSALRDDALHLLKDAGVATVLVTHDPEEAMFMADRIALMRRGRFVQLGGPQQLYRHPVSAFAASFFGDVSRLTGVARGGWVETPFGALPAPDLADGARALVLIRPEGLKVGVEGDVAATLLEVRPLGPSALIHLEIPGDPPLHLHARRPLDEAPEHGAPVRLTLDRHQAFVFPEDADSEGL